MPVIVLKSPWTNQPQVPVEIDPKYGKALHLQIGGITPYATIGNTPAKIVTPEGIGLSVTTNTAGGALFKESSQTAGDVSVIVVTRLKASTGAANTGLFSNWSNTGATRYIHIGQNDTTIRLLVSRTGANAFYDHNVGAYGKCVIVAVLKADGTCKLYVNNVLVNTFTNGPGAISASGQYWQVGTYYDNTGTRTSNSITSFSAVVGVALDDVTVKEVSQNPWQIFTPAARPLYFDVGAGGGAIDLEAAALAVTTASGTLTTGIPLSGSSASVSAASGSLTAQITLAGSAIAQAVSSALLSSGIAMTAAAVAQAAAQGTLATAIRLLGTAGAQAAGSGSLTTSTGGLEGNAQASASATASLGTQIRLSGSAIATAAASGSLAGSTSLVGAAVSTAYASGALTVNIALTASALAQAIAQGSLTTQILLDADAAAQAQAGAALSGGAGFVLPAARANRTASTARRSAALSTSRR